MNRYIEIFENGYRSLFLDKIEKCLDYTMFFSNIDKRVYWNAAHNIYPKKDILPLIKSIENNFYENERRPSFIQITGENTYLENILFKRGYKKSVPCYWMKTQKHRYHIETDLQIEKVNNLNQVNDFINIFTSTWKDPSKSYEKMLKTKLLNKNYKDISKAYIGYKDGKAICISGIVEYNGTGMLHSVAVIPKYKGKGYGKAISQYAINNTSKKEIILQHYGDKITTNMYTKLGFENLFSTYMVFRFEKSDFFNNFLKILNTI